MTWGVSWKIIWVALVYSSMFWFTLVVSLWEVRFCGISPGVGVQLGTLLQKLTDGQPPIQSKLASLHGYACTKTNSTTGRCVQYCQITREKVPVQEGPILLGHSQIRSSSMVSYLDTTEGYHILFQNYRLDFYLWPLSCTGLSWMIEACCANLVEGFDSNGWACTGFPKMILAWDIYCAKTNPDPDSQFGS